MIDKDYKVASSESVAIFLANEDLDRDKFFEVLIANINANGLSHNQYGLLLDVASQTVKLQSFKSKRNMKPIFDVFIKK
jgi:hypothetical protein